jgi:phenylalanyl-tRNA synthetase beta chain
MAGIMGGEDSGITLETTEMFLEAAFFAPKAIAGRARRYGFRLGCLAPFRARRRFRLHARALERATR